MVMPCYPSGPNASARTGGSCECSLGAERPDLRNRLLLIGTLEMTEKNDGFLREILDEKSGIILG